MREFQAVGHALACPALIIGLLFWGAFPCAATSAPTIQTVADSAAYGPRVAPGSLASIFGANLASATDSASAFPLPTTLGGASVTIGGASVPLLYASPTQINFQVPSGLSTCNACLIVNGPGGASASFTFAVTSSAPAIFQYGTNRAVAQNGNSTTVNSSSAPAASGTVIIVYLTGIGPVDTAVADGQPASTPLSNATAAYSATIGAATATIQFLGLAPGYAGLAQANILIPTMPTGDYPLVLTVGGYLSASAIVSVSGSGTYTSPLQLSSSVSFANTGGSSVALYYTASSPSLTVAYVCGANRIVMVDVTSAVAPAYIGEFGDSVLNGYGDRCAINTSAATPYLVEIYGASTSAESFAVYGLSNPKSPNLLVTASTPYANMVDLSFSGNYAFITTSYITYQNSTADITAQHGDLLIFDFTNPAQPLFLTILAPTTLSDLNLKPDAEVVDQLYSYIASSTATGSSTTGAGVLNVLNIASPTTPYPISQVTVTAAAILLSFDVSGNTLLAAGNTTGQRNPGTPDFDFTGDLTLTTMNLTNVQAPAVVTTFTTSLQVNGTFHVAGFYGDGIFAIVNNPPDTDDFGPSSLMIVDASTPSAIVVYPFQTQFGFSGMLTTNNGYLLAATSLGLNIYKLQL
jgi:uncharacterized protein (TIGR03437 family)